MNQLASGPCVASVLIVEDDEGVALLERRALERHGFAVLEAASAADAVAAVQAGPVDLIVMDYRLPDSTTGLELLARLKDLGYDLPVIMVTGFSDELTAIHALRQGVRDFVPKTTQYLDYLPDAVERVLKTVRTERRLTQSEARFQSFMDNSPAIAFIKDAEGRLLYANRRFAEECGQSSWQGKSDDQLWPPETARLLRDHDASVLAADQPLQFTETLSRSDGTVHHWLTCRFPLEGGQDGTLIGGMAVDVTQQKAAEDSLRLLDEQLRQSQKMEAIGQLAGGVAHDFNNLLTIIMGYSRILSDGEEMPSMEPADMFKEIHKAAESAAQLTRQLLAFSRKQLLKPQVLNLNAVVADFQKMLKRVIGEDISIHISLAPELDPVSADPGQIEQVMMNLVVNARDAMPQGGDLSIATSNVELDETYTRAHAGLKPGRYVMLAVSDSGCGMDAATQARIFEPFFTTKGVGKGTGLGLATVYGIVKQSEGHLWVYSELGRGTTFKVYFPAHTAPQARHKADDRAAQKLRGDETVLLVEDDDSVRALSRSMLELYGYTVLEASDPREAIRMCQSYPGAIDVLVTDVVMPHLNGRRLAELLLPERPDMKVLYMSGYTDDAVVRQGILDAEVSFVQKPFTPSGLAMKMRSVLDGAAS